jgi:hypothetical protein
MKKETETFLNPFEDGVTYDQFLKAKGNKSIEDYCKGKLTENQIETLNRELNK